MKGLVTACLSGSLFGAGLVISGMTEPSKVKGFLDFFGPWDPSLLLVMAAAIGIHMPIYWYVKRRAQRVEQMTLPPQPKRIDMKLIGGATLFGVGWGLGGYCPGPAIASVATGRQVVTVLLSIVFGVFVHEWLLGALSRRSSRTSMTVARQPELTDGV